MLVRYANSGLLQPVNADGSSIFKGGSTVPLKLDLADADGTAVTTADVEVQLERVSSAIDGDEVEALVDATPTNGKTFEYKGGHYQFNLSTKSLAAGTWRLVIRPGDGAAYRTRFSLR